MFEKMRKILGAMKTRKLISNKMNSDGAGDGYDSDGLISKGTRCRRGLELGWLLVTTIAGRRNIGGLPLRWSSQTRRGRSAPLKQSMVREEERHRLRSKARS